MQVFFAAACSLICLSTSIVAPDLPVRTLLPAQSSQVAEQLRRVASILELPDNYFSALEIFGLQPANHASRHVWDDNARFLVDCNHRLGSCFVLSPYVYEDWSSGRRVLRKYIMTFKITPEHREISPTALVHLPEDDRLQGWNQLTERARETKGQLQTRWDQSRFVFP